MELMEILFGAKPPEYEEGKGHEHSGHTEGDARAEGSASPRRNPGGEERAEVDTEVERAEHLGQQVLVDLRELIAATVEECNRLPWAEASNIEEQRAAESLTMSTSAIGVKAMMRGKPPEFKNPLPAK